MNTELSPEQKQELLQAFTEWSKHPVTKQMLETLRAHMNNTVDKMCTSALQASVPDALVRQYSIQLATYNQVLGFMSSVNSFIGTIPTIKQ